MRRLLAALLCAILGLSTAQAQYRPGYAPNFRSGFQFISGLPTYDFANGSYPQVTVSRASSGDLAADAAGNYTAFAANTLRRTNVGGTIEGAQTNAVRNSAAQGAVVGSPGSAPNNWALSSPGFGVSVAVSGTGSVQGSDYTDFSFSGTASGNITNAFSIVFEGNTVVSAATNQLWALSTGMQVVGGSVSNVTLSLDVSERTSAGAAVASHPLSISATSSLFRYTNAATLNGGATAAFIQPGIRFGAASGTVVNFTLRVVWPNLKQWPAGTSAATMALDSPIRTTGTAATRAADSVSFAVPAGFSKIFYTFDDGSTQQVSVSPGAYTIPTNLTRPVVRRLQVQP